MSEKKIYKATVTEAHLDKALLECPVGSTRNCLIAQAVAEAVGIPTGEFDSNGFSHFSTFNRRFMITDETYGLVGALIRLFDGNPESNERAPEDVAKIRAMLPYSFEVEDRT